MTLMLCFLESILLAGSSWPVVSSINTLASEQSIKYQSFIYYGIHATGGVKDMTAFHKQLISLIKFSSVSRGRLSCT